MKIVQVFMGRSRWRFSATFLLVAISTAILVAICDFDGDFARYRIQLLI